MLGVKARGGLRQIREAINETGLEKAKYSFAPSGQDGVFYNYAKGRSLLGVELLFLQIEGKDYDKTLFTDAYGNAIGYAEGNLLQHISYLSVPLYYGFTINNFSINLGVQTGYAIMSSGKGEANGEANGYPLLFEQKYSQLNINSIDFGPRAGVFFKILKSLSLEANYYYWIVNIYNGPTTFTWKTQQMTLGLRYTLFPSEK